MIDMKRNTEHGASLIEVMVALFILAIGLLGVLAMQTKSMQYNQSAYSFSQAAYLAGDLAERIRTNSRTVNEALYYSGIEDCQGARCAVVKTRSDADLSEWQQNIAARLPSGEGTVESFPGPDGQRTFIQITVRFDDSRSEGRAPTEEDAAQDAPTPSTVIPAYTLTMEI